MKTARVYTDFTSGNGYGAYLNGLKFFNRKNEELPVTDIVSVNSNKVTFKLNNVPGTIDIVNNYGGSYVSTNIFRTEQGYTYSILPQTKNLFTITFESDIRDIGADCGVDRIHPHLFRATFATNLLRKGVDIHVIAKLMGHSKIETTARYILLSNTEIEHIISNCH